MPRTIGGRIAALGRRRLALAAVAAAVLAGALFGLFGRGRFEGRYAVPPAVTPQPAVPAAPPAALPPPAAQPDEVAGDEDEDAPRIAAAIARATRKALDRGEPVRWHKAGQSGYVVVSAVQTYPGRVCRTVSATLDDDGEDDGDDAGATRSGDHLWCLRDDADDWRPER